MVGLSVLCLIPTLVGLVSMDQVHRDPMTFQEGSVFIPVEKDEERDREKMQKYSPHYCSLISVEM